MARRLPTRERADLVRFRLASPARETPIGEVERERGETHRHQDARVRVRLAGPGGDLPVWKKKTKVFARVRRRGRRSREEPRERERERETPAARDDALGGLLLGLLREEDAAERGVERSRNFHEHIVAQRSQSRANHRL